MQYGRITYWCCKCKCKCKSNINNKMDNSVVNTFNKYLYNIITNYLNSPGKYINILHDICKLKIINY